MSNTSALTNIPSNQNLLQTTKYSFVIPNLRNVTFFCQSVIFPSVSTNEVLIPTPFSETYRHGDKLIYEPLTLTFIVDEDMRSWQEAYDWLVMLTYPHKSEEYRNRSREPIYYDGMLTFNTNSNIKNIRFKFQNCHPTALGSIQLSESDDANMIPICDLTLRYDTFEIVRD